jgi:hypothetical protein
LHQFSFYGSIAILLANLQWEPFSCVGACSMLVFLSRLWQTPTTGVPQAMATKETEP